jgi:hypothetical protein
LGTKALVCA